eukprot:7887954-Ditylum_brightwellii.AAC.1
MGKHMAEALTTPSTTIAGKRKFYCKMHGCNSTHNTEDCFEVKRHMKRAKPNTNCGKADKVNYKDLNAFINTKEVKLNAFNKFCSLNVESSDEEDKLNKHAPVAANNNDSS